MKKKKVFSKILAIVLVLSLMLSAFPNLSVFAHESSSKEKLTEKGELWQPESNSNALNFEGDLSIEELQSAKLDEQDTPEIVSQESIEEKGHVNRLWEQEEDLNSIVFQNRDGTKTMYYYNYPVKYKDANGKIKDKSNKISQTSSGDYTNAENDINSYFPKKLNRNKGIELKFGEYVVEMAPDIKGNSGASRQTGHNKYFDPTEYVQYPNVFDESISLRYTPTFEGYKEDIVLSKYTGINEFSFRLYTDGLSLVMNEDGAYYLIDPLSGEIKTQIGDLVVYDSKPFDVPDQIINESVSNPTEEDYAKKEATLKELIESVPIDKNSSEELSTSLKEYFHQYKVETVKQDNEYLITIVVDEDYLTDSERVYPVYVDPTLSVETFSTGGTKNIMDAPIYANKPSTASGGNTYNVVGYQGSTYGVGRTLMKFPGLSSNSTYANLPTNQITSLQLHIYEGSGSTNNACIDLWQYTGTSWTESTARCNNVGWDSYSNNFTWNYINCSGWQTFNLTSMVATWKSGGTGVGSPLDKGIIMTNYTSEYSSAYSKHFMSTESSYKPYLTYTYKPISYITLSLNQSKSGYIDKGGEYWYKFTPPQTDYYNIYTTGSTDTYCELYQGTSLLLETDDDDGDATNFMFTRKLSECTTYYFKVRGYSLSTAGSYSLKVESDFINRLQDLHDIAKTYADDDIDAVELTMQFIRRQKYDGTYSDWDKWALAAGDIDVNFESHVQQRDSQLYDYFSISKAENFYYYSPQGDIIDIPHLCATYNIYHYNSVGNLGGIYLAENLINNLGGWGGDLRSMIPEVMKSTSNSTDYNILYNKTYSMIGNSSNFSMPDLYSDIDAFNLYNTVNVSSLKTTFENYYYNGGVDSRYTDFTNDLSYNDALTTVKEICKTSGIINTVWPIYQLDENGNDTTNIISLSTNQQNAIATAFTDYIWEKVQEE